ncbi:sterile alpha motif domain-containing protein 9-like [Cololabis saira]|uniref:sterile alpha motif domain-containing protein 9-like n=1 Tax=Cololabis saira TaxID=129043 RepID=UPI002AD3B2B7|nr:sterile alpha motif domain-containing protein 9-like [Cololabis saira]
MRVRLEAEIQTLPGNKGVLFSDWLTECSSAYFEAATGILEPSYWLEDLNLSSVQANLSDCWASDLGDSSTQSGIDCVCEGEVFTDELKDLLPPDISARSREEQIQWARKLLSAEGEDIPDNPPKQGRQPGIPFRPYPFGRYHDTFRYIEGSILSVTESGALDLIEPCHEYKAFTNTSDETKFDKFTKEVIRFGAACMNSRTNGTIHFGIADEPHGQVLGVVVKDREAFTRQLKTAIDGYFEHKHKDAAQICIKPPRFVEVLNKNTTSSDRCVIEVDIASEYMSCKDNIFHTYNTKKGKKKGNELGSQPSKHFYIREGGSTRDLLAPTTSAKPGVEFGKFVDGIAQLSERRKQAEEKHLRGIKSSTQGSRLSQMITGGASCLDKSHFECYVVVTNKSHPSHLECLEFFIELNPTAVLDFDPESAKHGLQHYCDQKMAVIPHSPGMYKITEGIEDIANKLRLTRNTSWVFCNGGFDREAPSDTDQWLKDKGGSVRNVISFLCRKDVLPNKRFLVIFVLLSTVRERMDPLVETFSIFLQELRGTGQILCICDSEEAFTSWRDLIEARCAINISSRCIYELSFAEVNGTILSLWSKHRRTARFLPCGGGSSVLLEKKLESSLDTLDVLSVNQCNGENEDRIAIEENFYKGGKVSWWNFYFSEQPGSVSFIKRDKFDYITNTLIQDLCSLRKACVLLNLFHVPGCGGTTLSMHVLWALRERFRCAVLRNHSSVFAEVADQVVKLLMCKHEEQKPRIPVLLMIDDFDDMEKVLYLQQLIEKECSKKDIQSKSPQVILLNCMRSEFSESTEPTSDTIFIGNDLSEKEQKRFEEKLKEIEQTHKNAETFYGFMIMKKNFKKEYIQGIVRKTLKSFDWSKKHAQLLAVLALLDVYCKGSALSISLCEDFLDLQPKPVCGNIKVEDAFGKFSNFITRCTVEGKVVFNAVKMIHSSISKECLHELTTTGVSSKAEITNLLLTTSQFYESIQGKDNLLQDVRHILVKRYYSSEDECQFSPLIQDIASASPGMEELVLQNASKRFQKDAIVSQLLARYYYLKKKDFSEAKSWAKQARDLSKDSSYIADTSAQVLKHELRIYIPSNREEPVRPKDLGNFLTVAQSAMEGFQETQRLAKKESAYRSKVKGDQCPINTSGCLGEVHVGVLIIDMLKKIPVFSPDGVRHDLMSQVLSGDIKIQEVEENDPRISKNKTYYHILKEFEDLLSNLKYRMKMNIDFLDNLHVNLSSRFGMKDRREEVAQNELFRCLIEYAKVFCKTDSASILKNKMMSAGMKLLQMRQFLESRKADTFSGILSHLSTNTSAEEMEQIVTRYKYIFRPEHNPTVRERINFIYANVVLSCIKLNFNVLLSHQDLLSILSQVLGEQVQQNDSLSLFFIAVVLLWPHPHGSVYKGLAKYISQMKASYHEVMKDVWNGKSPKVHFLLGKKLGYQRLVDIGEIKRCTKADQEQITSMWGNGRIWEEEEVKERLLRVTGEVNNNRILACTQHLRLEVAPMYKSQISGVAEGSKVSFFLGFTMKHPLALDIELLSQKL